MKKRNWIYMAFAMSMTMGTVAHAGTETEIDGEPKDKTLPVYGVNETESKLYWEGSKPGGTHHGTVQVLSGKASTDGKAVTGGSFVIDLTSIQNEDVGNEGMREKLVNHLKSEDFFYVEKYPKAQFRITGSESLGGQEYMITGDLTIRGNTHEISFPAEITMDDQKIYARTGKIGLDRTKWEVNHMSKSVFADLKDRFIEDEMIVKLDIHFDRQ